MRTTAAVIAATVLATAPALVIRPAAAASTDIVINEVSRTGSYVELRNLRAQPVDISGWGVWVCRGGASGVLKLVTIPSGHRVPGQGSYLVAGSSYAGSPSPDLVWNGKRELVGFPSARLTNRSGAVVDQVADASGNPCVETSPAVAALSGSSGAQFSLGRRFETDTDDNSRDFGDVQRSPQASGERSQPARPPTPISLLDWSTSGETHTIEAVVTGIDDRSGADYSRYYPEQRGVWVQEEPADEDGNPQTSEGLFVADIDQPTTYRPGDVVRVTGYVLPDGSAPGLPRGIKPKAVGSGGIWKIGTAPVPEPVDIDPARAASDGQAYFRTLAGMRVRLAEGTANSGGTNKFGELFVTVGGERKRYYRTDTRKSLLGIADDAGAGNPANPYRDRRSSTHLELDLFDQVEDVVGPLGFTFENYKIYPQPGAPPRVRPYAGKPYPIRLTGSRPGQVRISSFNVENFFPAGVPVGGAGTENTPQGVPTEEEYAEQRDEILTALDDVLGRPDIIAVQEVYANAAGSPPLADLATRLSRGTETYTAYVAQSNDGRGIANGYLVKSTVTASNPRLLGAAEASSICEGSKLFARPPFVIDVDFSGRSVTLFNNHFKSKGGGSPDPTTACREAQASFVRARVAEIEAADGEAIVLGDLNAYEDESPLAILTDPAATSLTNLWSRAPEGERYSYAFQGKLQTLDYMVVTHQVAASMRDFRYVHIDTDYADRSDAQGRRVIDGHGLSDHNPPVLTLPTSLDGPETVVPEVPWPALLLLAGLGVAVGSIVRHAR